MLLSLANAKRCSSRQTRVCNDYYNVFNELLTRSLYIKYVKNDANDAMLKQQHSESAANIFDQHKVTLFPWGNCLMAALQRLKQSSQTPP